MRTVLNRMKNKFFRVIADFVQNFPHKLQNFPPIIKNIKNDEQVTPSPTNMLNLETAQSWAVYRWKKVVYLKPKNSTVRVHILWLISHSMIKDMQTPPPPSLRSGGNFMKGAEWAEKNEKMNKKFFDSCFSSYHRKLGWFFSLKWP